MRFKVNTKLIVLVWFLSVSISIASDDVSVVPLRVGHAGITESLKEKLDQDEIWYEVINQVTLAIRAPVPSHVIEFLNSEILELLPPNRSGSWPKSMFMEIRQQLENGGIDYEVVEFDRSYWLVWSEADIENVNRIVNSAARKMNIRGGNESDFQFTLD